MRPLTLALLLLAALPAGSSAATVSSSPGTPSEGKMPGASPSISFEAAPGEANALTLTLEAGEYVFREAAAPVTAGQGCRPVAPQEVRCPRPPGGLRLDVGLGDGADAFSAPGSLGQLSLTVSGGDGDDTIGGPAVLAPELPEERPDVTTYAGDAGDDTLTGGPAPETLDGGAGRDALDGGPGGDVLQGGAEADVLRGQDGDDVLEGDPREAAPAPDSLYGGGGRDRAVWDTDATVRVDLADPGLDGREREFDDPRGIEDLEGGRGANFLFGDDGPNVLTGMGSGGAQVLKGRGGSDRLVARQEKLFLPVIDLDGGAGDDDLSGDEEPRCGPGTDVVAAVGDRIGDCEAVQLGSVALAFRARIVRGAVVLRLFRHDFPESSGFSERTVELRVRTELETLLARRRLRFPAAGSFRLPLTRAGRRLFARPRQLVVGLSVRDALDAPLLLRR